MKNTNNAKIPTVSSSDEFYYNQYSLGSRLGKLAIQHIEGGVSAPAQTVLTFSRGCIKRGSKTIGRILIKGHGDVVPVFVAYKPNSDDFYPAVQLTYADVKFLIDILDKMAKFVESFERSHEKAFRKAVDVIEVKLNELKVSDPLVPKYNAQIEELKKRYSEYVYQNTWVNGRAGDTQLKIDTQKALEALETI